jgi:hypothetical protein
MSQPWGPSLWRIVHTFAERVGRQTIPILIEDERRAWLQFLKSLEHAMPCQKCRRHYRAYRQLNPLEFYSYQGEMVRTLSRTWLWKLHTKINTERGIESPPLEDLPAMYAMRTQTQLQADIQEYNSYMNAGLMDRTIHPDAAHAFRSTLSTLRRLVG